jgi:hypothetical protein
MPPSPRWIGSTVMATGIVSVGLGLAGQRLLSAVWLAAAALIGAAMFATALLGPARGSRWTAAAGVPGCLAAVAGTLVLATRATADATLPGAVVAALSTFWIVRLPRAARPQPAGTGAAFLPVVVLQGAAIASAGFGPRALAVIAAVLVAGGIAAYAGILRRFDVRELWRGAGDHWICGGALAITSVAAATVASAGIARGPFDAIAVASFCLAAGVLAILVAAEAARPRPAFDVRRWATVFPLGMYAVAAFPAGAILDVPALRRCAEGGLVVAAGAWLLVAAGTARRLRLTRRRRSRAARQAATRAP